MQSFNTKRLGLIQLLALSVLTADAAAAQALTKPQVANLIAKVENGVDQFRDYLQKRGDNATAAASSPQSQSRLTLSSHFAADVFMGAALGYTTSRFAVLRQ